MTESARPEVEPSPDAKPGAQNFRLRFCWSCLWTTALLLAVIGAIGWFVANQVDAARAAAAEQESILIEQIDDLEADNLRLRSDLERSENALKAARKAVLAGSGGGLDALTARAQALPEPERRTLGLQLLGEQGRKAADIRKNLARLPPDERAALFSGLPGVAIFRAWFEGLEREARLEWVRRLPGLSEVGPTKISAPGPSTPKDGAPAPVAPTPLIDAAPSPTPETPAADGLREARAQLRRAATQAADAERLLKEEQRRLAEARADKRAAEDARARAESEARTAKVAANEAEKTAAARLAAAAERVAAAEAARDAAIARADALDAQISALEARADAERERAAAAEDARTLALRERDASNEARRVLKARLTQVETKVAALDRARAGSMKFDSAQQAMSLAIDSPKTPGGNSTEPPATPTAAASDAARSDERMAKLEQRLAAQADTEAALRQELKGLRAAKAGAPTPPQAPTPNRPVAPPTPSTTDKLRDALGAKEPAISDGPIRARLAFGSGSADLSRASRVAVDRFAETLLAEMKAANAEGWRLIVTGHTDKAPIRTREFPSNWSLSAKRAAAVAERLIAAGVPAERLYAVARADADPVDAADDRAAFAKNRRIEFRLIGVN